MLRKVSQLREGMSDARNENRALASSKIAKALITAAMHHTAAKSPRREPLRDMPPSARFFASMTEQRAPQPSPITFVSVPRRFSLHRVPAPATLNLKPESEGSAMRVLFHFRPALRSQRTYAPVQVLFQSCARPGRTIIDRASRGRISGERHCISGTRQYVTHECEAVHRTRRCINHARQPFDSLSIM